MRNKSILQEAGDIRLAVEMVQLGARMQMLEVLKRVPGGYGVVVNPGTSLGLELSPAGIGEILKDFA